VSIGPIDHVGIVVRSIDEALPRYRALFGLLPAGPVITVVGQGVRLCFLPSGPAPAARLELVEPVEPSSGIARFLTQRGEGVHHVCFGSDDLAADLAALEAHGAELLDREPGTVLWELLQAEGEAEGEGEGDGDGEGEATPQSNP
jgi:methylmalonyl-CoA/ethylmalonyl-CoA epimerase